MRSDDDYKNDYKSRFAALNFFVLYVTFFDVEKTKKMMRIFACLFRDE